MWPYRDWVIRAINNDMPFDQFTIEQLAGDLLPNPTVDQLVATGFHRNTLINTEGGTKPDQFRVEQSKDRTDTTGGVWLALTVGCAGCHDHKYDPISQREYYSLYAFFDSTQDQNSVSPTVPLPSAEQSQRLEEIAKKIAAARNRLKEPDPELAARRNAWEQSLAELAEAEKSAAEWKALLVEARSRHGAEFTRLEDGSLLVSGANRAADLYLVSAASPLPTIRAVRLELFTDESLPKNGPGRAPNGNFVLADLRLYGPLASADDVTARDFPDLDTFASARRSSTSATRSMKIRSAAGRSTALRKGGRITTASPSSHWNSLWNRVPTSTCCWRCSSTTASRLIIWGGFDFRFLPRPDEPRRKGRRPSAASWRRLSPCHRKNVPKISRRSSTRLSTDKTRSAVRS
jgi:hypothetical protein